MPSVVMKLSMMGGMGEAGVRMWEGGVSEGGK